MFQSQYNTEQQSLQAQVRSLFSVNHEVSEAASSMSDSDALSGGGGALIRGWALINLFGLQCRHLCKVGCLRTF